MLHELVALARAEHREDPEDLGLVVGELALMDAAVPDDQRGGIIPLHDCAVANVRRRALAVVAVSHQVNRGNTKKGSDRGDSRKHRLLLPLLVSVNCASVQSDRRLRLIELLAELLHGEPALVPQTAQTLAEAAVLVWFSFHVQITSLPYYITNFAKNQWEAEKNRKKFAKNH